MLRSSLGLSLVAVVVLTLHHSAPAHPAQSDKGNCNPNLKPVDGDLGYKQRGNRCEGLYVAQTSVGTLHIASLVTTFEAFDPGEDLVLEWDAPPEGGPVRLKVVSLTRRFYYQMDTERPRDRHRFTWMPDVLNALGLGANDLGVVASTVSQLDGRNVEVYLPVRLKHGVESAASVTATVSTSVVLREVYVTLEKRMDDGRLSAIIEDRPLQRGYYPAGRPINVVLPKLDRTEYYLLTIGAFFGEIPLVTSIWLFIG